MVQGEDALAGSFLRCGEYLTPWIQVPCLNTALGAWLGGGRVSLLQAVLDERSPFGRKPGPQCHYYTHGGSEPANLWLGGSCGSHADHLPPVKQLTDKIDHLQTNIGFIRKDLDSFRQRGTKVEKRVSCTEDPIRDHNVDLHYLKIKVKPLVAWAEDAENHNRRNNLRILGLLEGV